jgi:hypothetical protein
MTNSRRQFLAGGAALGGALVLFSPTHASVGKRGHEGADEAGAPQNPLAQVIPTKPMRKPSFTLTTPLAHW